MKRMLSAALALLMLIGTAIPVLTPTVTAAETAPITTVKKAGTITMDGTVNASEWGAADLVIDKEKAPPTNNGKDRTYVKDILLGGAFNFHNINNNYPEIKVSYFWRYDNENLYLAAIVPNGDLFVNTSYGTAASRRSTNSYLQFYYSTASGTDESLVITDPDGVYDAGAAKVNHGSQLNFVFAKRKGFPQNAEQDWTSHSFNNDTAGRANRGDLTMKCMQNGQELTGVEVKCAAILPSDKDYMSWAYINWDVTREGQVTFNYEIKIPWSVLGYDGAPTSDFFGRLVYADERYRGNNYYTMISSVPTFKNESSREVGAWVQQFRLDLPVEDTSAVHFSADGSSSAVLTNTTNSMKYSVDNGATWNAWDTFSDGRARISNLAPGNVWVKAFGTPGVSLDSDIKTFEISRAEKPADITAKLKNNDASTAILSGVNNTMQYSKDNGASWTSITADKTEVSGIAVGSVILVRVAPAGTRLASENREVSVTLAAAPDAPTGLVGVDPTYEGASDGRITGVNSSMEYASDAAFSGVMPVTGTEITGLAAGTYYIRIAATATTEASGAAMITLKDGVTYVTRIAIHEKAVYKTEYIAGEPLDVSGLSIWVYRNNKTVTPLTVTESMVSGFNSAITGTQTLTVTCEGVSTTYDITVKENDNSQLETLYWLMFLMYNSKYEISAAATEGGTISDAGITRVKYGKSITYTITPDAGYEIKSVVVDGTDIGAVTEYTFEKVKAKHVISAVFAKKASDADTDETASALQAAGTVTLDGTVSREEWGTPDLVIDSKKQPVSTDNADRTYVQDTLCGGAWNFQRAADRKTDPEMKVEYYWRYDAENLYLAAVVPNGALLINGDDANGDAATRRSTNSYLQFYFADAADAAALAITDPDGVYNKETDTVTHGSQLNFVFKKRLGYAANAEQDWTNHSFGSAGNRSDLTMVCMQNGKELTDVEVQCAVILPEGGTASALFGNTWEECRATYSYEIRIPWSVLGYEGAPEDGFFGRLLYADERYRGALQSTVIASVPMFKDMSSRAVGEYVQRFVLAD